MIQDLLFQKLNELDIPYTTYTHEPVYTVEQALKIASTIPGQDCKNLFLKDSKGNLYLLVAVHNTVINLKQLSKYLKAPELRFASAELLQQYLGVEPGSVTPFGLINDQEDRIIALLDSRLFESDLLGFHPLYNNATTVIAPQDLQKFIESCGNRYRIVNFNDLIAE